MTGVYVVEFNGTVFVPTGPISLPAGTRAVVRPPADPRYPFASPPPPPITDEHRRKWAELERHWAAHPQPDAEADAPEVAT